jgi:hypothetical protein
VEDYFHPWHVLARVQLLAVWEDANFWRCSNDNVFSAKSMHSAFFAEMTRSPTTDLIWKSRGPYGCKFFAWLATRNRCWMADRIQRHGLQHPTTFPMCDHEPEALQHILLRCVVAHEVWMWDLCRWDKPDWVPLGDT